MNTCTWLVERRIEITADMIEGGWFAECEADNWEVVECGAPAHDIVDGWECEAGHHHFRYGTPSQIAEERMEALAERDWGY
jgi:hypothetical protein